MQHHGAEKKYGSHLRRVVGAQAGWEAGLPFSLSKLRLPALCGFQRVGGLRFPVVRDQE
jgi:hypothetical protein